MFTRVLDFTKAISHSIAGLFFMFFAIEPQAYAHKLASHEEVQIYKQAKTAHISNKRQYIHELGGATNLNLVATLAVLEDEKTARQIDNLSYPRLVLAMILGNGDPVGVTSTLTYTTKERNLVERVVKQALSCWSDLNLTIEQIWSTDKINPNTMKKGHIDVLTKWFNEVKGRGVIDFEVSAASDYKDIDDTVNTIIGNHSTTKYKDLINLLKDKMPYGNGIGFKKLIYYFDQLTEDEKDILSEILTKPADISELHKYKFDETLLEDIESLKGYIDSIIYRRLCRGKSRALVEDVQRRFEYSDRGKYKRMIWNLRDLSDVELEILIFYYDKQNKDTFFAGFDKNCENDTPEKNVKAWIKRIKKYRDNKKAAEEAQRRAVEEAREKENTEEVARIPGESEATYNRRVQTIRELKQKIIGEKNAERQGFDFAKFAEKISWAERIVGIVPAEQIELINRIYRDTRGFNALAMGTSIQQLKDVLKNKRLYRQLCMVYHPDKVDSDNKNNIAICQEYATKRIFIDNLYSWANEMDPPFYSDFNFAAFTTASFEQKKEIASRVYRDNYLELESEEHLKHYLKDYEIFDKIYRKYENERNNAACDFLGSAKRWAE